MSSQQRDDVVVVGAGISGVTCARALAAAGVPVRVLDRGRRVGGRMASRRLGDRTVDTGASYFTVSDDRFAAVAEDWRARGLAREWTDTFAVLSPRAPTEQKSGPLRWAAPAGLRSLVEDLAGDLDVVRHEVTAVGLADDGHPTVDGDPVAAVVLAMPDAQARRLLDPTASGLAGVTSRLDRGSEPVLALSAWWRERTWDPGEHPEESSDGASPGVFHGGFVNDDDVLAWVADDGRRRGDDAPCLVAHSTPELAARHLEQPDDATGQMLGRLRELLSITADPVGTHVQRWSSARPAGERESAYLLEGVGSGPGRVGVCGDGWGPSPKVEGAYLSGRALGEALAAAVGR